MSDQQQALHRWEVVSQGDLGENANTYRMRVPGGGTLLRAVRRDQWAGRMSPRRRGRTSYWLRNWPL